MTGSEALKAPVWAEAKADQRLAFMKETFPDPRMVAGYEIIACLLQDPPEEDPSPAHLERWERVCDNCGVFVPINRTLWTGVLNRELHGKQVAMTFAACDRCARMP